MDEELQDAERAVLKNVALMVGGISAAGESIEQSTMNGLGLEMLCMTMYKAYLIGTPKRLPEGALGVPGRRPSQGAVPAWVGRRG